MSLIWEQVKKEEERKTNDRVAGWVPSVYLLSDYRRCSLRVRAVSERNEHRRKYFIKSPIL